MTEENKVVVRSRIKHLFGDELLRLLANVCDTKRIDSNQKKMKLVQQLLKKYDVRFDVLGGATNRVVLFTDSYTIKFALDRQGYKDNWMEYALSPELQPYVTRTFETNGYVLVAEPVKTMTYDDFKLRKADILRVLEILSSDYLLGDVGYIKKNFTNWGLRDDGSVVILDYAYCHRATEKLFTCQVCGNGTLVYDSTFSYLKCSNSTVCMSKYTYNEIKMLQGDQVDTDTIEEAKGNSVTVGPGEVSKDMHIDEGIFVNSAIPKIRNMQDYIKYIKEKKLMFGTNFDQTQAADLMVERLKAKTPQEIKEIEDKLIELVGPTDSSDPIMEMSEDEVRDRLLDYAGGPDPEEVDTPVVEDDPPSLDDVIDMVKGESPNIIAEMEPSPLGVPESDSYQEDFYDEDPYEDPLDRQIRMMKERRKNRAPVGSISGDGEFMNYQPTTTSVSVGGE